MPAITRSLLVLPLLAAFALAACTSEMPGVIEGDVGETDSSALTITSCNLSRSSILANSTGGRHTAIERGFGWLDAQVPYSQSSYHAGYRTDCSGFVSMCWQLGTSYTTADFYSGGGQSEPIGSYDSLVPGDALVYRSGGSGHIVLFLGWNDSAHGAACVLEQASTASDMQFRARTTSSLKASAFKAIRADKLPASGATSATPGSADDPTDDNSGGGADDPTDSSAGTGQKCTGTGDCNPGNNGSGMICVGGFCKAGCASDAQCPGSKTCIGGQCR
jgi:hypothetical protein